ncbi:benzoate 4-monooxygenase cytochrome P450 [Didymella exigua CBS 183.55]|uniref:Benzoate 4-monooxygenase cytochrome P450 n=1 Tax=Didymella exigua CBS 183.55 TaxID=1150837 RepID=A0A6A5R6S2_9PLEO|nr:benzoate 4-monooxygenase cytochrome P450 [Didymella exigua CBS 183.55]KAF1923402.1 benzoate 4-monooxygenase cytochrome P450 [Didymella exigua CBS 183.55]
MNVFAEKWSFSVPSLGQLLTTGAILAVVYYITTAIHCIYFHPLSRFPGPKFAAFSRLPFAISAVRGQQYKWMDSLHEHYGKVVRVGPDELTTISSGAWNDLYLQRPQLPKDPHPQTPPLNGADSLFTANGSTHQRMRRTLLNGFNDRALRAQSPIIESYADLFIQRLRHEAAKSPDGTIDLAKFYGYAALDIISDLAYGESFHGLEGDNEHNWVTGFFLGAKFGAVRNHLSYFYPLDRIFGFLFLKLTAKIRARNWKYTADLVTKRLEMGDLGSSRFDFVSPVIGNINNTKEKGITRNELNTHSLAVTIAGSQLPTVALATATYLLLTHPVQLRRLLAEIRSSFQRESDINIATTAKLPYLAAVIDETLRIHHPTPIHLPRLIPSEGLQVDGEWIPGNTVMGIAMHTAQTSSRNWAEPLAFHPERFVPPGHAMHDARFDHDDRDAFKPFSIGTRNCIGGKVFLAEARILLARTLWNFELRLGHDTPVDWLDQKAYLVFEPKPLRISLVEKSL